MDMLERQDGLNRTANHGKGGGIQREARTNDYNRRLGNSHDQLFGGHRKENH